jgi:regulator of ribonuclease activity A
MKTADLFDEFPEVQVCEPIFQSFGGHSKFHGQIRTIKCNSDFTYVKQLLSEKSDGGVLVVESGGSLQCAMLGDLLAKMGMDNGWVGAIIHGMIRDSADINEMAFGVKSLGVVPVRSNKNGEGEVDVLVEFAGVKFNPGDYVYSDEDGILVSSKKLTISTA